MSGLRTVMAWLRIIALAASVIAGTTAIAAAANISGTITNNSGKSGRVFIAVQWENGPDTGLGVSIDPAVTTSYTIRGGLQNDLYRVKAFMDTQNTGIQHANDPAGHSSSFTMTGSSYSGANITLTNPPPISLQPPSSASAITCDKAAMIFWKQARDTNGNEIATSYKIYWSVTPNPGPSNMAGGGSSPPVKIYENGYYPVVFPSNGAQYYFAVTAFLNSVESTPTNVNDGALITIGPPTGGVTVSGTVNIQGVTLIQSKPLAVFLNTYGGPRYFTVISEPSSSQTYSIAGVQPGVYIAGSILTMNSSGLQDDGIVSTFGGQGGIPITVESDPISNVNMTLIADNASVKITTDHENDGSYWLNFDIRSQLKRPVNVAVTGPQLGETIDLAPSNKGRFQRYAKVSYRPTLLPSPDSYTFAMAYSDGTNTGASPFVVPITGIVDSFATLVTPIGTAPYPFSPAVFSWSAPQTAPTPFYYAYGVSGPNNPDIFVGYLPNNTTSITVPYSFTENTSYNWGIGVYDNNGNRATSSASFTPSSNLVITSFTPSSGIPGTRVTITGANFDGTTQANNRVIFPGTGVYAPVVSATTTQLLVTVPAGAAPGSGPISIAIAGKNTTSSSFFTILPTVFISGKISSSAGPVGGGLIELLDNELVKTISANNGTYTLNGLPSGQTFSVKVSKAQYPDVYSKHFNITSNLTDVDFRLYSAEDLARWNVAAGKGVIRGQLKNNANNSNITGATVTITSPNPANYKVMYANTDFDPDPSVTSTTSYGIFFILNITPGDSITVSAAANGFSTSSATYTAHADAVTEGGIRLVDHERPAITAFNMKSPHNNLTVPIISLTATDNAAVTGYMVTDIATEPSPGDASWSTSPPASFTFSGTGSRTAYAWAKDATGNVSYGSGRTVIIDQISPTTSANPAGGTKTGPLSVYLTSNEPATIYYTTNGTPPTTDSASFTDTVGGVAKGPIVIYANTTLKFFACDMAGNSELIKTEVYLFGTVRIPRQPVITYTSLAGAYANVQAGETIQARGIAFSELLTLDRPVPFVLKGGYDASFNSTSGFTSISKLTIARGAVTLDKIVISQ